MHCHLKPYAYIVVCLLIVVSTLTHAFSIRKACGRTSDSRSRRYTSSVESIATTTGATTPIQPKVDKSLNVRIDETWYDLSGWRKSHPSGEHWIDLYRDRDATEVMHAFHSEKARAMFTKMPKSKQPEVLNTIAVPISDTTKNFRILRNQLEAEGWWKRDMLHEARLLTIWASIAMTGLLTAKSNPVVSIMSLAIANTAAGWLGHDYIHGVDKFSFRMRNFGAIFAGMSSTWWSDKHNKHHAVTNEVGTDEDLSTEPLLYVYAPNPKNDSFLRKMQHIYFLAPLSLLFTVWRFDSLKLMIKDMRNNFKRKTQTELLSTVAHYAVLFKLVPIPYLLISLFVSGLMTAIIVTVTHQSEDLFHEHNPHFVQAQYASTRDVICSNIFIDWLWGGMQYQLEHHLFPSMPRSKYPELSKIVKKFATDNGLEYRVSNDWDILKMNWNTYRKHASSDTVVDRKHFQGKEVSWGGRGEVVL